jgi:hypothetical protein
MRILSAALLALVLQGCATPVQVRTSVVGVPAAKPVFEHLNPIALNEYAADRVGAGDIATAWILLERAALLAPHDQRIADNLAVVRAWRARSNQ